jgi:hypothetical protein
MSTTPAPQGVPSDIEQMFRWLCSRPQTATLIAMRDKVTGEPRYLIFSVTAEEGGLARMNFVGEVFSEAAGVQLMTRVEAYPESGIELQEPTKVPRAFDA